MKKTLASIGMLAAAAFLLYRKSLRLYWTYDSPLLLHRAVERDWNWEVFIPDTLQYLFTPLLALTDEAFLALFGLEPWRWYLAQLVIVALVAIALFAVLRLYVATPAAASGALLFLLGPPVATAASSLYLVHYFEAILFGALAALCFVLALRRGSLVFSTLSALCYLAAISGKEIAVPLPLVLFLLPEGNWRKRARHLIGHAAALGLYAGWRLFVVKLPLIAYGWTTTFSDLATVPWRLVATAAGASLVAGLLAIALMLAGAAPALRSRVAIIAFFCAIAPILPVSAEMQDRFTLAFWVWLSCAFAIGVRRPALIAATIVVALIANRQQWTEEFTRNKRMSDEAYVWVHERGDVLLRNPAIPAGTMPELEWMKEELFHHAKGARWFYDDIYLCLHSLEGRRILEYNPRTRRVEEVHPVCAPYRTDVPLTVEFEQRGAATHWRFGPYRDGEWRVIAFEGEHAWDVPREGGYVMGSIILRDLRVRYRSPEGWVTYSDPMQLDFARQRQVTWRR